MVINKHEPESVVDRQCRFLALVTPQRKIERVANDRYTYEYIPGVNASCISSVFEYLKDHVWIKQALQKDKEYNYVAYLQQITDTDSKVLSVLEELDNSDTLVHGDATLENFLQTSEGITCIDPGMPRGFCHFENDIGKLLQSYLTHWQAVRHGSKALPYYPLPVSLEVTNGSIASLISHWYRIVKNYERHPESVQRYAVQQAIPILTEMLRETDNSSGYRWLPYKIRTVYNKLLPKSI